MRVSVRQRPAVPAAALMLVAGSAAAGATALGSGPAGAANPPTISVSLSGTDSWTIDWDATPLTGCRLHLGPLPLDLGMKGPFTVSDKTVVSPFRVRVECAGANSNAVTVYSPRNATNDMRTSFSNATQGMFGS